MISEREAKHLKIALLTAALLLCVAVLPRIPYGFYVFLRLVVCIVAGTAAYLTRGHETLFKHFVPLVVLALLFNPVFPVWLTPDFWILIYIGTAVYFLTLSKKI